MKKVEKNYIDLSIKVQRVNSCSLRLIDNTTNMAFMLINKKSSPFVYEYFSSKLITKPHE